MSFFYFVSKSFLLQSRIILLHSRFSKVKMGLRTLKEHVLDQEDKIIVIVRGRSTLNTALF
jgi:hypothetical protein